MTKDNGVRALAERRSDREREHTEESGPDRRWWRCMPVADAYLYLPDAAALDRLRRVILWAADELTRTTGDGEVNDTRIGEVVSALRAALQPEGSAGTCAECDRQERLLSADQAEQWVADAWSRFTEHPHAATDGSARDGG